MVALSVILPTFNRAPRLRACLEALTRQTQAPCDFEVIVVNDGSTDETETLLAEFRAPFALVGMTQDRLGQTVARNRAVEAATGRYCLFLDDDMRASPTLVAAHLNVQQKGDVVGIGQITTRVPTQSDWFARNFTAQWNAHFEHLNTGERAPTWRDCYSGNLSAPRDALRQVGGFAADLPMWFDLELGYRLHKAGLRMVYLRDACAEHDDVKSGGRLLREMQAEGQVASELWRRHPELLRALFGTFWEPTPRAAARRRALLALRVAPDLLLRFGTLLSDAEGQRAAFHFLERYAYWYGVRRKLSSEDWRRVTSGTAILMYHAFGGQGERASRFVMPLERFAEQLAWLQRNQYNVMGLQDYLHLLEHGSLPPARTVILTFDDGYMDQWTRAYPVLREFGMPATFFIVSGHVGGINTWDAETALRGRALMGWTEIQTLARNGMGIGAHTRTHPHLTHLTREEMCQEWNGAREELERALRQPVRVAAYPFGERNAEVEALAQASGFIGCCTASSSLNVLATPAHALRRIEIMGTDSLRDFGRKVTRGRA